VDGFVFEPHFSRDTPPFIMSSPDEIKVEDAPDADDPSRYQELKFADELFQSGREKLQKQELEEAIDLFSRALTIKCD